MDVMEDVVCELRQRVSLVEQAGRAASARIAELEQARRAASARIEELEKARIDYTNSPQ